MILGFDLDETLISADLPHIISFNKAFKEEGLKKIEEKKLVKTFGPEGIEVVRSNFPRINIRKAREVVKRHDKILIKEGYKYAKALPHAKEVLKKLRKEKHILIIISNCSHKNILCLLKGAKISRHFFSAVVGNDDVRKGKPAPNEIFKAQKLVHHKVDFMIGDTIYDIRAAKRAKVKVISVLTGHQSKARLKKERPDYIIRSLNELPNIIKPYSNQQEYL